MSATPSTTGWQDVVKTLASVLAVLIPFLIAVFTWRSTEKSRLRMDEYQEKEARYAALAGALKGFFVAAQNRDVKARFLEQMNLCWLYCPDDVVRAGNVFLNSVQTGAAARSEARHRAPGK